jgi:hypothetical protein
MAIPPSRLLATIPQAAPGRGRTQPPTAAMRDQNGACAILQTTTRFLRKSGFWKHFGRANLHNRNLANNNTLVSRRLLPDNRSRPMLTTESWNRHLRMR